MGAGHLQRRFWVVPRALDGGFWKTGLGIGTQSWERWGTTGGFRRRRGHSGCCGVWTEGYSVGLTWRLEDSEEVEVGIQGSGGAALRYRHGAGDEEGAVVMILVD